MPGRASPPATSGTASVKRVASAVGEGSVAIQLVHQLFAEARLHDVPGVPSTP